MTSLHVLSLQQGRLASAGHVICKTPRPVRQCRSQRIKPQAVSFPSFQGGKAIEAGDDGATAPGQAPDQSKGGLFGVLRGLFPGKESVAELRQALLDAIEAGGDVEAAAAALSAAQPPRSAGRSQLLKGRWRLLWSSPQSDFSRTQRRFGPIPTRSVQLIGEAGGLEATRAANLVQIAGGAAEVQLFSTALPDKKNSNAISIGPPFTLKLKVGPFTTTLVENIEGDDINRVEQTYLETTGQPGDLRISRVGRYGEKKVAGSTFVHIRE